jgi:RHS repeat-associated protein
MTLPLVCLLSEASAATSIFTGKERDTESGNDYFGARYYGSSMGRFVSPDDGVDQDPEDPQSWNLYSYVRNNPLGSVDADGRQVTVCTNVTNGDGSTGQTCNTISDDAYKAGVAAQQAANANNPPYSGIQAPGGDRPNGNITDNGQVVGTATWSANPVPDQGQVIPGDMGLSLVVGGKVGSLVGGMISKALTSLGGEAAGGAAETATQAASKSWKFGAFKSTTKWANQLLKRGWTEDEISETIANGERVPAINNVNPANGATRYVSPTTGKSVVVDNVTNEVLHVGGSGFQY